MISEPKVLLDRIENQREALGLAKFDLVFQLGITYTTYIGYFSRKKVPYLETLHSLCSAIGLSLDDLLGDEELPAKENENNILYWVEKYGIGKLKPTSLLYRLKDKVGVARLFKTLSSLDRSDKRYEKADEVVELLAQILLMEDVDFLAIYSSKIRPVLSKFTEDISKLEFDNYCKKDKTLSEIYQTEYIPLFLKEEPSFDSKPSIYYIWNEIDRTIKERNIRKGDFYTATGISSVTYNMYYYDENRITRKKKILGQKIADAKSVEEILAANDKLAAYESKLKEKETKAPSPSIDLVARACGYLGIDNLEEIIRKGLSHDYKFEGIPPFKDETCSYDRSKCNYIFLYSDYAEMIQSNLCNMPRLSSFFSALCAFSHCEESSRTYSEADFNQIRTEIRNNYITGQYSGYRFILTLDPDNKIVRG